MRVSRSNPTSTRNAKLLTSSAFESLSCSWIVAGGHAPPFKLCQREVPLQTGAALCISQEREHWLARCSRWSVPYHLSPSLCTLIAHPSQCCLYIQSDAHAA